MIEIVIKLFNHGDGLLDTRVFTVNEGDDVDTQLQDEMAKAIGGWTLAVGDTIKIEEV